MELLRLGELNCRALGPANAPALVLCHGFGAPGGDLVPLAEALDPHLQRRWILAEAPLDLRAQGIPGRAWWHIDMMRLQMAMITGRTEELVRETPEGLAAAHAKLAAAIDALGTPRDKILVGGFSQGAMLATELALHSDAPFAGLAILSGALVSRDDWQARAREVGSKLHVFQSHGRADPILPFEGAVQLREMLRGAGVEVAFVEHPGGHEIPPIVLRGLLAFANARLGA